MRAPSHHRASPSTPCSSRRGVASAALWIGALLGGCAAHPVTPTEALTFSFDFSRGPQGFIPGFADYPPRPRSDLRIDFRSPRPPGPAGVALRLFLSGVNHSDDLFMFFKGPIPGLLPGTSYRATVSLEIATNTPVGCLGVGGAPGESVWIKAGVTAVEPLPVREGNYLRMNIDIGSQSAGGAHAVVLGDIASSRSCEQPRRWERKSFPDRATTTPIIASSDGRAWLWFGTDSGFEALTEIYFTRASVTLTPM